MKALIKSYIEIKKQENEMDPSPSDKDNVLSPEAVRQLGEFCLELDRNAKYLASVADAEGNKKFAEETYKVLKEKGFALLYYTNHDDSHVNAIIFIQNPNGTISRLFINVGDNIDEDTKMLSKDDQQALKDMQKPERNEGIGKVAYPAIEFFVGDISDEAKAKEVILQDVRNNYFSDRFSGEKPPDYLGANLQNLQVIGHVSEKKVHTQRTGSCSNMCLKQTLNVIAEINKRENEPGFTEHNYRELDHMIANIDPNQLPQLLNLPKPTVYKESRKDVKLRDVSNAAIASSFQHKTIAPSLINEIWDKTFEDAVNDPDVVEISQNALTLASKKLTDIIDNSYGGQLATKDIKHVVKDWRKQLSEDTDIDTSVKKNPWDKYTPYKLTDKFDDSKNTTKLGRDPSKVKLYKQLFGAISDNKTEIGRDLPRQTRLEEYNRDHRQKKQRQDVYDSTMSERKREFYNLSPDTTQHTLDTTYRLQYLNDTGGINEINYAENQKEAAVKSISELHKTREDTKSEIQPIKQAINELIDGTAQSFRDRYDVAGNSITMGDIPARALTDEDIKRFYGKIFTILTNLDTKSGSDIDYTDMKDDPVIIEETKKILNSNESIEDKEKALKKHVVGILSAAGEEQLADRLENEYGISSKASTPHTLDVAETIEYLIDPQVKKHGENIHKKTKDEGIINKLFSMVCSQSKDIKEKDVAEFYRGLINVSDENLRPAFPKINTGEKDEQGEIIYDDIVKNTTKLLKISCGASDEQKLLYGAANLYSSAGQEDIANEIRKKIPKNIIVKLDNVSETKQIPGLQQSNNQSTTISPSQQHRTKQTHGLKSRFHDQ